MKAFLALALLLAGCATLNKDATLWQRFTGNGGPYEVKIEKRTEEPRVRRDKGSLLITNSTRLALLFDVDCTASPRVRKYYIPSQYFSADYDQLTAGEMSFMGDKFDESCKVEWHDLILYQMDHPAFDYKKVWADPYVGDQK